MLTQLKKDRDQRQQGAAGEWASDPMRSYREGRPETVASEHPESCLCEECLP
jgi:hypothetical protein